MARRTCCLAQAADFPYAGGMTHQRHSLMVATILASFMPLSAESLGDWKADRDGSIVSVSHGDRPVLEYQSAPNPLKPYVIKLYSPSGVQVLRDAPHDHLHHHGLMYAIAVDGVDFWAENAEVKPGKQAPRRTESDRIEITASDEGAVLAQSIDWIHPSGTVLLREMRRITVDGASKQNTTRLVWRSRLEPPAGADAVQLAGSPYFGLGMRFVESMDTGGEFFNSARAEGTVLDGTLRHVPADWCAYAASVDGKPVTVAMFGHPANIRRPTTWFTMTRPFAYLSATLVRDDAPLTLTAGEKLEITYVVAIWDGPANADAVGRLYQAWAAE